MTKNKDFSPERKAIHGIGTIVRIIGSIMFISVFFIGFSQKNKPKKPWNYSKPKSNNQWNYPRTSPKPKPNHGFPKTIIIGFGLVFIGGVLTTLARNGVAGSGLILDAEQERRDLEPVSRIIGGRINDAFMEVNLEGKFPKTKEIIKIRCLKCESLNDEEDNFCGKCGSKI